MMNSILLPLMEELGFNLCKHKRAGIIKLKFSWKDCEFSELNDVVPFELPKVTM
jgi:hypothetical protein